MKKKIDVTFIATVLVCLLPFVLSAIFYSQLPEQMAIHWGTDGEANGFAPKLFAAFGLPTFMLVIHLFVYFMLNNDPKKANMSKALRAVALWTVPVLALGCQIITILWNLTENKFNFSTYVIAGVGILIIIFGNYLPKCKQNYVMGIRLPWTLNSEENWNRTHRFSGYVWIIGGLLIIVTAFIPNSWLFVGAIGLLVIVPCIYSYILFKKGI